MTELRKDLPIWSINSFAQYFLEEMGDYREEYAESCRRVRDETHNLVRKLAEVPYLHPYPTQGNFVLCSILHGFTGQEVTERLFEDSRILVNNCGSKNGLDGDFIRIACRTEEDNNHLVEALKRIAKPIEVGKADMVKVK